MQEDDELSCILWTSPQKTDIAVLSVEFQLRARHEATIDVLALERPEKVIIATPRPGDHGEGQKQAAKDRT